MIYLTDLIDVIDDIIDYLYTIKIKPSGGTNYSSCTDHISTLTDYKQNVIIPFVSDFPNQFQEKFDLFNKHVVSSLVDEKRKIVVSAVNNVVIYTKFTKYYKSIFLTNYVENYIKSLFSDVSDVSHIDDDSENTYCNRVKFIIDQTKEIFDDIKISYTYIYDMIDTTLNSIHSTNEKIGNLVSFMSIRNTVKSNIDFDNLQFIKYYSNHVEDNSQAEALKIVIEKNYTSTTQIMDDIKIELNGIFDAYTDSIKSEFMRLNNSIKIIHMNFKDNIPCCTPDSIDSNFDMLKSYIDDKIIKRIII